MCTPGSVNAVSGLIDQGSGVPARSDQVVAYYFGPGCAVAAGLADFDRAVALACSRLVDRADLDD